MAREAPPAPVILVSDDGTRQTLTASRSTYTAAEILQQGSPCTVDVLAVIPLNQLASDGGPATGLVLLVHRDDVPDYQAQIGTHIALPRSPGSSWRDAPAGWVQRPGLTTTGS